MKSRLITKILDSVPVHIKPINYLMDSLDIGRESAYRRLRGEIPFTLKEASKLSLELGFSIDTVVCEKRINRIFLDVLTEHPDPSKRFLNVLQKYCSVVSQISKDNNSEILSVRNRLPLSILIQNEYLFKFYYYNYIYQNGNPDNRLFADTVIPKEITSYCKEFLSHMPDINTFCYIINSRSFFLSFCREIQYCYSRNLITLDEVRTLQNTLHNTLNHIMSLLETGKDGANNIFFYLSYTEVSTNSACISFGDNIISQFWIYYNYFIEIRNSEICYMHRNWFNTMKKSSILITKSNEIFQSKFLDQQRYHIDSITEEFMYL
ncbi:hypothetical protein AGMMS50239_39250 [Bacteroidia bacterium]|nr:hypothetical protein AGMMS50239_39250 [Bacteroidia bacterium]